MQAISKNLNDKRVMQQNHGPTIRMRQSTAGSARSTSALAPEAKSVVPPVSNQNSSKSASGNFLSLYLKEMSGLDVFKPEQELAIAKKIESLEIEIWVRVLSFSPATHVILKRIGLELQDAPSFRGVKRAATILNKDPQSPRGQKNLEDSISKIGEQLRDCDTDRRVLDEICVFLQTLRDSEKRNGYFRSSDQRFAAFLVEVKAKEKAAQFARNEFVKANLRLVVSIARRFNHGRMSLDDLIQEGNLGLLKAVQRFDYRKGFRFSTYASWWIRHAISRGLADKGRVVRLPVHMIDAHYHLSKARHELTLKLQRPPTNDELSEATNMAITKIEKMRTYLLDSSLSLDKPVNDEGDRSLADVLEDPKTGGEVIVNRIGRERETQRVMGCLEELKPIEADILRQRFGFEDDQEQTLKEIGIKYNLSRERIRQLQEQALEKMRLAMALPLNAR